MSAPLDPAPTRPDAALQPVDPRDPRDAPAGPARADPAPPAADDARTRTGKWLRERFTPGDAVILIVDDEPTVIEMVKIYLADAGYRHFVTSTDPTQTMELLESSGADAVLLDVFMPSMSGLEVLARIRAGNACSHVPVLVLTSATDPHIKQQALELDASDFLAKPVDPSELLLRLRNVLAAKAYQDRLAFVDEVTGLPNRRHFAGRLKRTVARAEHAGRACALLNVGLDRFQKVKDALGPVGANDVLRAVAERIELHLRPGDLLGCDTHGRRLGALSHVESDEFMVLLPDVERIEPVCGIAERVLEVVATPLTCGSHELCLGASIGVAIYPRDGSDAEQLFTNAGRAMHFARESGGGRVMFYSDDLQSWSSEQMQLETDLRRALESNALALHYQPKIDLASGRIVGVEALLRWTHPERGVISPASFIPLAEEAGLIERIGAWVLDTACAQAEAWSRAGMPALGMAVNVSAHQLNTGLIRAVNAALAASGLPAEQLTLELTESAIMVNPAESVRVLGALKSLGVRLSVDDFGTGYSSLAYLKRFPLDELKIDRSFVKDVPGDEDDVAIVTAVVVLAKSLGLELVAEGVETEAQRRFLEAKGCEAYQGYLFARPLPPHELEALVAASTEREAACGAAAVAVPAARG